MRSPSVPFSLMYWLKRLHVCEKFDLSGSLPPEILPESTISDELDIIHDGELNTTVDVCEEFCKLNFHSQNQIASEYKYQVGKWNFGAGRSSSEYIYTRLDFTLHVCNSNINNLKNITYKTNLWSWEIFPVLIYNNMYHNF